VGRKKKGPVLLIPEMFLKNMMECYCFIQPASFERHLVEIKQTSSEKGIVIEIRCATGNTVENTSLQTFPLLHLQQHELYCPRGMFGIFRGVKDQRCTSESRNHEAVP